MAESNTLTIKDFIVKPTHITTPRICTRCGIDKDISEYFTRKRRSGKRVPRSQCKKCCNISSGKWHKLYPEKNAEAVRRHRKKHYKQTSIEVGCKRVGITVTEYFEMFRVQNGKCAICGISHLELTERISIDHCHETGNFRGLLCSCCNRLLGSARDNQNILENAIQYLKKREV